MGAQKQLDVTQLVFFTPVPALYFKTYHLIDERSLTAKLAVTGTIIKGMHSISKKIQLPPTLEKSDLFLVLVKGSLYWERCRKGRVEGMWRARCGGNTVRCCVWWNRMHE